LADNFRDKYRTKSLRLEGFDYSSEAVYFITICTENKAHFFGKIQNDHIVLSSAGSIVATEWMRTNEIRPRAVLGEWVVMPNHFHALLYIKPKKETCRDGSHPSETNRNKDYKNEFGPREAIFHL
jgi:REP element-mobilizing transposase RayT